MDIFNFLSFQKVPGRMGMILTLYLISANVYNSVKGPKSRGFSFIEVWMIGTQIPILIALLEYGYILFLKKISRKVEDKKEALNLEIQKQNLDAKIKKLDFATMMISFLFFIIFATVYFIIAFNWDCTEYMQTIFWLMLDVKCKMLNVRC